MSGAKLGEALALMRGKLEGIRDELEVLIASLPEPAERAGGDSLSDASDLRAQLINADEDLVSAIEYLVPMDHHATVLAA